MCATNGEHPIILNNLTARGSLFVDVIYSVLFGVAADYVAAMPMHERRGYLLYVKLDRCVALI